MQIKISNKYRGKCEVCCEWVSPQTGYVCLEDGKFMKQATSGYTAVWCAKHVPDVPLGERKLTVQGKVITPCYEKDNIDLFRALPGARWNPKEICWDVSLASGDRYRLLEVADKLGLAVDPELRKIGLNEQASNAKDSGLFNYQVHAVDWMSRGNKRFLADDMGLGKTIESLMSIPENTPVLVVAPANVKYNWVDECKKWRPELKSVPLNGRGSFRFPKPGEVIIVNFDILPSWAEAVKVEGGKPWELTIRNPSTHPVPKGLIVIVDEAQKVKNYKTLRSKRVKGLCHVAERVWGLSGTPLENLQMDLWGTLESLNMNHVVFGTWKKFCKYMNACRTPYGMEFGTPEPIVPELLRRVVLRRVREEVLPDLPLRTYHAIRVDLTKSLVIDLDDRWDNWEDKEQLPPFEEFSTIRRQLAEAKIPILTEMVEDHEEQSIPLIVCSDHKSPVEAIGKRDGWGMITGNTPAKKRQEVVTDFQAGRLKGIACTIVAGGVGLNMHRAWKMIRVDRSWVPANNDQIECRICRIGQTSQKVEIVDLEGDHVLERHISKLLTYKQQIIAAAVDTVIEGKVPTTPRKTTAQIPADPRNVRYADMPF